MDKKLNPVHRNMNELINDLNDSDWSVRAKAIFDLKDNILIEF